MYTRCRCRHEPIRSSGLVDQSTRRRAVTVATAVALTLSAASVRAADASADDRLAEITVTATRTGETSLQQTPIAVSALSVDELDRRGVDTLRDIGGFVPNVTITSNEEYAQPYIRGIGTGSFSVTSDPSTTVHLDGVYLARPVMLFTNFVDLERVEVLRGPQGTLYGRNAAAGGINLVSKKPSADFEGRLALETGSFSRFRVTGALNGPIAGPQLTGRLSFIHSTDDGFVKNLRSTTPDGPARLADEDVNAVRGALRFQPSDTVDLNFSADYLDTRGPNSILKPANNVLPALLGARDIADRWTVDLNDTPDYRQVNEGAALNAEVRLANNYRLNSITGYRRSRYDLFNDEDGTELDVIDVIVKDRQDQFSQELQVVSDQTSRFSWIGGLFYFHENASADQVVGFLGDVLPRTLNKNTTDAYAGYLQATFKAGDRVSAIAGGRYSYEEKSCSFQRGAGPQVDKRQSWTSFTPKVGLNYQATDDLFIYGTRSKGFKSGVCNARTASVIDPENVLAYELGAKSEFLDQRLRVNTAVFYTDYKDLQVLTFQGGEGADTRNAAQATLYGLELEVTALPVDALALSLTIGTLHATYDKFESVDILGAPVDVSGKTLPLAPKITASAAADYTWKRAAGGEVTFHVDYKWTDDVYFTQFNDSFTRQAAYGLLNARVEYTSPSGQWRVAGYGENLTDKAYWMTMFQYGFTADDTAGLIRPPRTWGLKAEYRF